MLGQSGQPGTVKPGAAVLSGDYLVLTSYRRGGPITAVGLILDPERSRMELSWVRELPDEPRGYDSYPYAAAAEDDGVYLVSGSARLLVAADVGTVLAEASAPTPPSALPARVEAEFLVPEGDEFAAYDAATLEPRWRRPTPRGLWAGPPADGLCPIRASPSSSEDPGFVALWDIRSNALSRVPRPDCISPWSPPVPIGSLVVLSCDVGAGDRLVAVSRETGAVAWEAETPPPSPNFFKAPAGQPPPIGPSVVRHGDHLLSVNQIPSAEARMAATGELLWRLELADPAVRTSHDLEQPTALAITDTTAWVGTQNRRIVAVDAEDGTVRGETALPTIEAASSIFPMPGAAGSSAILAVGGRGSVYGVSI